MEGGRYSLFGCTMAPGLTGDVFEAGVREQLMKTSPEQVDDIRTLTNATDETRMPEGFAS